MTRIAVGGLGGREIVAEAFSADLSISVSHRAVPVATRCSASQRFYPAMLEPRLQGGYLSRMR
jgi:hypothetical protein